MSGSGRKALYLCTHRITSILRTVPYFSVYNLFLCLYACIYTILVVQPLFPVDWPDRTVGLGPDRTRLILVWSGPKVKDWTVKQSLFLVQTGLKIL